MWPKKFRFFREFIEDFKLLFLFNTIKGKTDGLTYYDLQQFGNIPHSNIYRMMKELEEKGDLYHKDGISKETGRPKHLYFLTEQGEKRLEGIRERVGELLKFLKERFPGENEDFNHDLFLQEATFKVWASPVHYILQQDIVNEEKIKALKKMENNIKDHLKEIRRAIRKLEKKV